MRNLRDVDGAISKYDACSNMLTRSLSPQISDADQGRTTVLRASRFRISTAAHASYFGLALDGVAGTLLRRIVCAAVALVLFCSTEGLLHSCSVRTSFAVVFCTVGRSTNCSSSRRFVYFGWETTNASAAVDVKFSSCYPRAVAPTLHFFSPTLLTHLFS
jgi:hypothetical protein